MEIATLYFNHNCNSYLLINNHECLLIDPGFNHNNCLIVCIKKRGLSLKGVLLTHGHFDHIEGLRNIKDIPVYMFKGEEKHLLNVRFNCSFMSDEQFVIEEIKPILLDDNQIIDIIGIKIKVIHTPFHTSGSVCYYLIDNRILFTGDTLFFHAIGRSDLPTSETRFIKSSLTKLFKLPHTIDNDTIVYPGHGPHTSLNKEYHFIKNEYLD